MYTRTDRKKHKSRIKIGLGLAAALTITIMALGLTGLSPFNSNAHALGGNATDFVTTWKTTTANEYITIPINFDYAGGYNYNVDWGDGNTSTNVITSVMHQYTTAGSYQVRINGLFPAISLGQNDANNQVRITSIDQWGNNHWKSMSGAFFGAINLTYAATDVPDLGGVTDMTGMFTGDSQFNGAIGNWDTSNVTNMGYMFATASSFNHDLSNWDVSHVTDLSYFFYQTGLSQSNYEATLIGWSKQSVKPNVPLYADSQTYCSTAAQNAHNILTSTPNDWVITGDTLNCSAPGNQAPVASNKNIITINAVPSTNTFPASDPDSNNLYFEITSQPTHGSVLVNQDGTYTYTPNPSFTGNDNFSYKASDYQEASNVATISISVANSVVAKVNNKVLANNDIISAKPTFSGTAPAHTTVTVTVHSDPVTCPATADANGNWSCSLPTNLTPGQHTVRVLVTYAGDTIQELGPYTVVVNADGTSSILTPDTGYGALQENWQIKLIITATVSVALIILGTLGLTRIAKKRPTK